MIRKAIIVLLTLAAVGIATIWAVAFFRSWLHEPYYHGRGHGTGFVAGVISTEDRYLFDLRIGDHAQLCMGVSRRATVIRYSEPTPPGSGVSVWRIGRGRFGLWRELVDNPSVCGEHILLSLPSQVGANYRPSQRLVLGLSTPCWAAFLLLSTYPAITFIRGPVRRYRRKRRGLCLKCGYNLTGNTSGCCPECGTPIGQSR